MWRRVVTDGVVIVGSILLAFGIDAAWDSRQERRLEEQYLERLIVEVEGHLVRAERTGAAQARVRDAALRTYENLGVRSQEIENPRSAVWDAYEATRTFLPEFADDVYAELLATGNLRLIQTAEARETISSYYRSLDAPPQFDYASVAYRDLVRGAIPPTTKLAIRDCPTVDDCEQVLSPAQAAALFLQIGETPGVRESASLAAEQWARGVVWLDNLAERAGIMREYLIAYRR